MLSRAVHAASPSTLRKLFVSLGFGKRFLLRWPLQGPGGTHKGQVCLVSPASFLVTHVSNLLGAYERDLSLPGTGPAHQVCWSCTSPALQSPILTQSTQRHQNISSQRDAAPAGRASEEWGQGVDIRAELLELQRLWLLFLLPIQSLSRSKPLISSRSPFPQLTIHTRHIPPTSAAAHTHRHLSPDGEKSFFGGK